MSLRLGKKPFIPSLQDLKLATYLDPAKLPRPPKEFGHEDRMPLPRLMLGNGPDDTVEPGFQGAGDCVFAMICNAVRLANALAGKTVPFTGKEAIAGYSEVTGYDPSQTDEDGNNPTDQGTDMRNALNWWRATGIADQTGTRHKLGAFLALDLANLQGELEALYLLDIGVALGIRFPASAMTEFDKNEPWATTDANADEGHAILWDAHRADETVETWARAQKATARFIHAQADEAYALLSPEMLAAGESPEGLDIAQLNADLEALA